MAGRLEGKVAFITGAARGQGRSHAVTLAREGADIIAVDITGQIASVPYPMSVPEDLAETVKEIEALDRRIVAVSADIRDYGSLKRAVDDGVAELGRLDIVSANAGIVSYGLLADLPEQTWQDMIDTTLTGAWHTLKAAVPQLRAGGRGGSVILTSSAAVKGTQHVGHYVAAKAGIIGMMRTAALELASDFIRVNAVLPGNVRTPMVNNEVTYHWFRPDLAQPGPDDVADALLGLSAMPVGLLEPADISNAVLFLASDEARYITGAVLPVDPGMTLK
jgi:(+)-trans-carveol dehydrogenase